MRIRLPFIDRIKMLSRDLKSFTLGTPRSYDVIVLPSAMQRGSQQSSLSSVPGSAAAVLLVTGKADRLWLVGKPRGRDVEHTHSNLG